MDKKEKMIILGSPKPVEQDIPEINESELEEVVREGWLKEKSKKENIRISMEAWAELQILLDENQIKLSDSYAQLFQVLGIKLEEVEITENMAREMLREQRRVATKSEILEELDNSMIENAERFRRAYFKITNLRGGQQISDETSVAQIMKILREEYGGEAEFK